MTTIGNETDHRDGGAIARPLGFTLSIDNETNPQKPKGLRLEDKEVVPMTETVKIAHLAACPEVIPTLAAWVDDEWGAVLRGVTLADLAARFEASCVPGEIPETFVAREQGRPIGMASLVAEDMSTRPDLTPWLASVYVIPEARRRGVGSALVRRAMDAMTGLGIDRLYLFTPDQVPFYRRLGWAPLARTRYRGEDVQIMVVEG